MTDEEYYKTIPLELKKAFAELEKGNIQLIDIAKKFNYTYTENNRIYIKASLVNAYTTYKKYKKNGV